jgi:alpha-glucosidase
MNYVGERPADPLTLVVHPDEGSDEAALYEDRGDGHEYARGAYARRRVPCTTTATRVTLEIGAREGDHAPAREAIVVEVRGLRERPRELRIDGARVAFHEESGSIRVTLTERAEATHVEIVR